MDRYFDAAVIGGGAVGLASALQIKKADPSLSVCVIEKEADTAFGTSGRNSAVVHAGFNNPTGSLKAKLCLEGSRGFEALAAQLGIDYEKTGKVVVGFTEEDRAKLEKLLAQGRANGVEGLEIVEADRLAEIAPGIGGSFGLYSPNTAVFNPFRYCTALAKKAHEEGVVLFFASEVRSIRAGEDGSSRVINMERTLISADLRFIRENLEISSNFIINSAGLNAGKISAMAGAGDYEIRPCRGEYHILEKTASELIKMPVYPVPNEEKNVLGIHLTPTTDGSVMFGPSAEFIEEDDDFANTEEVMKMLKSEGSLLCPELRKIPAVRSFSGIRPKCDANGGDFIIEESLPGFINLIGIESPGITASMPIGRLVAEMVISSITARKTTSAAQRTTSVAQRTAGATLGRADVPHGTTDATPETADAHISTPDTQATPGSSLSQPAQAAAKADPAPAIFAPDPHSAAQSTHSLQSLICRCEQVSAAGILEAFDEICEIGALPTIKGLKNRTGAFMGLCQGCFCTVDTADLLEKERNFHPSVLTYDGPGSEMFDKETRLK